MGCGPLSIAAFCRRAAAANPPRHHARADGRRGAGGSESSEGEGNGTDNWSRKEFGRLPIECLEALAALYRHIEVCGGFSPAARATVEMLFAKPGVDDDAPLKQRHIGIMPRLYRHWASARQPALN